MAEEIDLDHDSAVQGLFNSEIDLIDTCVTTDEETNMEEAFQDDKIDDHFQSTLNITDIKDEDLHTYLEESVFQSTFVLRISVYLCSSYSPRDHNENKVNADLYYVIPATLYF